MSESKNFSRLPSNKAPKSTKTMISSNAKATTAITKNTTQPSRLPVRSLSFSGQKPRLTKTEPLRATSPCPSRPTVIPKVGRFSLENVSQLVDDSESLTDRKTEPDKSRGNCKPKFEPRINKIVQQRINRIRSGTPPNPKSINSTVTNRKKVANTITSADSHGDSVSSVRSPVMRAVELSPTGAIEIEHKKLQDFQTDFMRKLRQTGSLAQQQLQQYKFVALIMNENCKLVVDDDELLGLPKTLPTESINYLQERCCSVVDAAFDLMFENLRSIQRARDEAEAKTTREQLRIKMQDILNRESSTLKDEISCLCKNNNTILSDLQQELNQLSVQKENLESSILEIKNEHLNVLTQLRLAHEAAMTVELGKRDKTIVDLQSSLTKLEEEKEQLESSLLDYKNENGDILTPLLPDNTEDILVRDKIIADLTESLHQAKEERHLMEIRCLEVRKGAIRNPEREANDLAEITKRDQIIVDLKTALRTAENEKQKLNNQCIEHNKVLAQLGLDHEVILTTETGKRDEIIADLKKSLLKAEDDREHYDRLLSEVKTKHADLRAQLNGDQKTTLKTEAETREELLGDLNRCLVETQNELANHVKMLEETSNEEETVELLRAEMEKLKKINQRMQDRLEEANDGIKRSHKYIEDNEERISFLETELMDAREFSSTLLEIRPNDNDKAATDRTIAELRMQVNNLEHHRMVLNNQVKNVMGQHVAYDDLSANFKKAQKDINDLQEKLNKTEKLLAERTQSELEIRTELNLSKKEVRKFENQVTRLNEQLERDRQLLLVRSEMINALQRHDEESRNKLDEMYCQVKEKNLIINKMNVDMASKTEEFSNLFGTLSSKQMEVRRQEHIIKLLEENNTRSSMLRIKQEERNAVMQDEIAQLKRSMRDYAKIIIGNGGQNCFEVVTATEVLTYHADEEKPRQCKDANCSFHNRPQHHTSQNEDKKQDEEEKNKMLQLATDQLQKEHKKMLQEQQQKHKDDDTNESKLKRKNAKD